MVQLAEFLQIKYQGLFLLNKTQILQIILSGKEVCTEMYQIKALLVILLPLSIFAFVQKWGEGSLYAAKESGWELVGKEQLEKLRYTDFPECLYLQGSGRNNVE